MGYKVIKKNYFKIMVAIVAANALCLTIGTSSEVYSTFLFAPLLTAYYLQMMFALRKDINEGKIKVLYGVCNELVEKNRTLSNNLKEGGLYLFICEADDKGESANIYIKVKKITQFKRGASYCLVFKENSNDKNEFSERNLIGYERINEDVKAYTAGPELKKDIDVDLKEKTNNTKTIYFDSFKNESED